MFTRKKIGKKEIYKARLMVRGYQPKKHLANVYSPVLNLETLRVLLFVTAHRIYQIHQIDMKGAFLYGEIKEDVYLKPPD